MSLMEEALLKVDARSNRYESMLRLIVEKIEDNGIILDDPGWSDLYESLIEILGDYNET